MLFSSIMELVYIKNFFLFWKLNIKIWCDSLQYFSCPGTKFFWLRWSLKMATLWSLFMYNLILEVSVAAWIIFVYDFKYFLNM